MTLDPATLPDPVALRTADGITLEAEVLAPHEPVAAAVVAHPDPRFGGTMRVPFIDLLFTSLAAHGAAAIRFNFRGAGGSGGTHDGGVSERFDVEAAINEIAERAPGSPVWCTGWSFGSDVCLSMADQRIVGWVAVAPPLMSVRKDAAPLATSPKLILAPEHDQFRPAVDAAAFAKGWNNTTVEPIAGVDHYLGGKMEEVVDRVVSAICGPA